MREQQTETLLQHMDEEWQEDWNGQAIRAELRRLHVLNDELLEALTEMLQYSGLIEERCDCVVTNKARAAIAKAEGKEHA